MRLLREQLRGVSSGSGEGDPLVFSNSGDMSQATLTCAAVAIFHMPIVCLQAIWSGTSPVGTLQLQGSVNGANWFNVGSTVAVSGNTGSAQVTDANAGYNFARVLYTKTSGTGTLSGFAQAKGV